jgi:hypothetical protein
MTGVTSPASMISFRTTRSSFFPIASNERILWGTNGDNKPALTKRLNRLTNDPSGYRPHPNIYSGGLAP